MCVALTDDLLIFYQLLLLYHDQRIVITLYQYQQTIELFSPHLILQSVQQPFKSPMMMPLKKEFEPTLPTISEVIQLQNFTILKPTRRQGCIKRQKGFNGSWKTKVLCFLFVPDQKLVCQVFNDNEVKVQETLNLATAKLSKKCSEVDDRICFGVVTPNDQKYLLTLKSSRECLKIFNEIVSAKKILGMSMFRSYRIEDQKINAHQNQELYQITTMKEIQQNKIEETRKWEQAVHSPQSRPQSIGSSYFKINSKQSEFSKTNTLFQNINKSELIQQCMSLQHLKGFRVLKELPDGNIYQNDSKMTKAIMVIYSPQSVRQIFTLFYQFDLWNSKVKKFNRVSRLSQGVYKYYVQFHKNGCFSSNKCCEVLLSLSKWDNDFYLTMNTTIEKSEYVDQSNWVSFTSCAKIKCKNNNPRQKQIYVCYSSEKNNDLVIEFMKQLKNLPQLLRGRAKLDFKELQIRNV